MGVPMILETVRDLPHGAAVVVALDSLDAAAAACHRACNVGNTFYLVGARSTESLASLDYVSTCVVSTRPQTSE